MLTQLNNKTYFNNNNGKAQALQGANLLPRNTRLKVMVRQLEGITCLNLCKETKSLQASFKPATV